MGQASAGWTWAQRSWRGPSPAPFAARRATAPQWLGLGRASISRARDKTARDRAPRRPAMSAGQPAVSVVVFGERRHGGACWRCAPSRTCRRRVLLDELVCGAIPAASHVATPSDAETNEKFDRGAAAPYRDFLLSAGVRRRGGAGRRGRKVRPHVVFVAPARGAAQSYKFMSARRNSGSRH